VRFYVGTKHFTVRQRVEWEGGGEEGVEWYEEEEDMAGGDIGFWIEVYGREQQYSYESQHILVLGRDRRQPGLIRLIDHWRNKSRAELVIQFSPP
jgi:hypothetical protein